MFRSPLGRTVGRGIGIVFVKTDREADADTDRDTIKDIELITQTRRLWRDFKFLPLSPDFFLSSQKPQCRLEFQNSPLLSSRKA